MAALSPMRALAGAFSALRLAPCRASLATLSRPRTTTTPAVPTTSTTATATQPHRALSTTRLLFKGNLRSRDSRGAGGAGGGARGRQSAGGGRGGGGKTKGKGKKKGAPERLSENQLRVLVLRMGLHSPAPPPLRMGRNRWLRHWTIHRAWILYQRQQSKAREMELLKLHQNMHWACEELRTTAGPGTMEVGYLFRRAMMHDGVFRHHGVPIEYARFQTESPGREPWNHGWKR